MHLLAAASIVLLFSFDGLRPDHVTKESAPNLYAMSEKGTSAQALETSFPASTFTNHATLMTGCTPEEHGIVSNHFLDPKRGEFHMEDDASWMECEPLWSAASRRRVKTAIYSWPMTQTPWRGTKPDYLIESPKNKKEKARYFEEFDARKEITQIIDWLKLPEKERPRFIVGYFPEIDTAGHKWGPLSKKTLREVKRLDRLIGDLLFEVQKLDIYTRVNFIFVSDHGMAEGKNKISIKLPRWQGVRYQTSSSTLINFYSADAGAIQNVISFFKRYPELHIYPAGSFPERWHYNHPRSGDLVITADVPSYIVFKGGRWKKAEGFHGYDPENRDMNAFFAAFGPAFKQKVVSTLRNTEVAPMIAKALGIRFRQPSR